VLAPLTLSLALVVADVVGEVGVVAAVTSSATPTATSTALSPGRLELASANAQDEYGWEGGDEEDRAPRLFITAWGGEAFAIGSGDTRSGSAFGGEVAYALPFGDLGLWGSAYKIGERDAWAPIALLRLTNRFATGRGIEAAFTFGVGAGRPIDWRIWFQVALGLRLDLGPLFLAGELSFEQEQLLRLSGGLGVKL
jgi:hypothetical protein